MSEKRTEIVTPDEFFNQGKKPLVKGGLWKWKDIQAKLFDSVGNSDRGGVSLVNRTARDSGGIAPNLNAAVQILKPGMENEPHRHSNFAIFIAQQGEGYTIVDDEKFEWGPGDIVFAPAWSSHGHCNTSETEDAILLTFQDVPMVSNLGLWFVEEPGESIEHIIDKEED